MLQSRQRPKLALFGKPGTGTHQPSWFLQDTLCFTSENLEFQEMSLFWVTSDDLLPNFSQPHERKPDKTAASILPGAVDLSEVVDPRKQKDKKNTSLQQMN